MNGCRKCPAFAKCTVYEYRGSQCASLRSTYGYDQSEKGEVVSFYEWAVKMSEKEVDDNEP